MEFHAKEQLPGLLDWMRQQMKACGGKTAVIGISGGKDSSVVAALAVAAAGLGKRATGETNVPKVGEAKRS